MPVPLPEQPLLAEAGVLAHVVPVVAVDHQRVDVRSRPAGPGSGAAHALDAPRRGSSVWAMVLAVHDGVAKGDGLGRRMIIVVRLLLLLLHLLLLYLPLGCAAIALVHVLLLLLLHHSSPRDLRQRRLRLGRVDVLPAGGLLRAAAIAAQIALAGVAAVGGGRRTRAVAAPMTTGSGGGGGRPTNTSSPGGAGAPPVERQILVDGVVNGRRRIGSRRRRTGRAHRRSVVMMAAVTGGTCRWRHARLITSIIWRLRGGVRVLSVLLQAPPLVSRMVQHGSAQARTTVVLGGQQ